MCYVRKIALPVIVLVCCIGTIVRSFDPKEVQGPFFFRKGVEITNMVSHEGKEDILENCLASSSHSCLPPAALVSSVSESP